MSVSLTTHLSQSFISAVIPLRLEVFLLLAFHYLLHGISVSWWNLSWRERSCIRVPLAKLPPCLPPYRACFLWPTLLWLLLWPLFHPPLLRPKNLSSHTSSQTLFLLNNIFGDKAIIRIIPIITTSCHSRHFYPSWAPVKNTVVSGITTFRHVYAAIPFGVCLHGSCCGLCQRWGMGLQKKPSWFFWLTLTVLFRTL